MNDARLANGSFPLKIGEQEFAATMLSDKDKGDLTGYIQSKYIEVAKNVGRESEDGQELLKFALSTAVNITWGTKEGVEIIFTDEGLLRLGWQMIRKRHLGLSFKDFSELAKVSLANSITNIIEVYNFVHKSEDAPMGNDKSSTTQAVGQ